MDTEAQELSKFFRGFAKIDLCCISSGLFSEKNVKRYLKILQGGQYSRDDPLHTVAVSISEDTLSRALSSEKIDPNSLFDPRNMPIILIGSEELLECLQGQDLLEAAKRSVGPRWWAVRLYVKDIPQSLKFYLTNTYSVMSPSKEFELLRSLWFQDIPNFEEWEERLGVTNFSYMYRAYRNPGIHKAIASLFPYVALWDSFTIRQLGYIISSHSYEEMTHYLKEIHRIWSALPPDKVDSRSVQIVEGMMPNYSLTDQQKLKTWITEGTLFPNIEGEEDRVRIQAALLAIEGRILSLRLFFLDASCLQLISLFLRQQLCVGKKKTIREAFMHRCKPDTQEGRLLIQVSEHEYEEIPFTTRSPQELVDREAVINGMLQVWMACFRYFIEPRRCKGPDNFSVKPILDPEGMSRIVQLAKRLGFNILKQDYLESPGVPVFRHVSKTLLGNVQVVEAKKTNYLAGKFRALYPSSAANLENTPLTTDIESRKASFRAGRPDTREYDAIRPVFFMKNIYSSSEPAKLYPTAFAVMREIFFSFFGRHHEIRTEEILSSPSSPVRLDPHPIGTPPAANPNDSAATSGNENDNTIPEIHTNPEVPEPAMDDIVTTAPIAAGFEDEICIGPLNKRCEITVHRSATEILHTWFQHGSPDLIIFFLFDSRAYYKFLTSEELELRSTVNTLSSTHYFLVINNNVAQAADRDDLVHESQTRQLLLVGRNDGPSYHGEGFDENGCITLDKLKEYLGNYDVATGKRRAIEDDVGQIPISKRKR